MALEWRALKIAKAIKAHDPRLYVLRTPKGVLQIYREPEQSLGLVPDISGSIPTPMLVICLTDTWKWDGRPVDWGIEPIMQRLRAMDSWGDSVSFETMVSNRERAERDEVRQRKNEYRAIAADMRRDFAKATNDINTSTM